MRIGLYGLPTAGKSFIMERIDFLECVYGSKLLRQYDPDFDRKSNAEQEADRKAIVALLSKKENIIVDGHYAFGDNVVFTLDDGMLYDVIVYLYINPTLLSERMSESAKNQKYLVYDIVKWQKTEIDGLREFCHTHNKDFYVIDNPPNFSSEKIETILDFLRDIKNGYSCLAFARECSADILRKSGSDRIVLLDGDKTLTVEDSSNKVFGYNTHIFDGNFYTGYQAWKQRIEFNNYSIPMVSSMPVALNPTVLAAVANDSFILTSGHEKVWQYISGKIGIPFYYGNMLSAETKYFITKFLQNAGKTVVAYGDGMNDYYMLKQADQGYLVRKANGSVSRSLTAMNLEGLNFV